jgi:hypothetical protein
VEHYQKINIIERTDFRFARKRPVWYGVATGSWKRRISPCQGLDLVDQVVATHQSAADLIGYKVNRILPKGIKSAPNGVRHCRSPAEFAKAASISQ